MFTDKEWLNFTDREWPMHKGIRIDNNNNIKIKVFKELTKSLRFKILIATILNIKSIMSHIVQTQSFTR